MSARSAPSFDALRLDWSSWPFLVLVRRELLQSLRQARFFVMLAALFFVALMVVAGSYPRQESVPLALAQASDGIVRGLVTTLLGSAMLLLPAYGATSILSERSRDTFDALRLTLVRPAGIVLAKMLNTVGLFALLVIATFPLFGVAFFLVGMDWQAVIAAGVVVLVAACSCGAVGVMCSATVRGPVAAVTCSYFVVLVVLGGYLIPMSIIGLPILVLSRFSWTADVLVNAVMYASPFVALTGILRQNVSGWAVLVTLLGQTLFMVYAVRKAAVALTWPYEPPRSFYEDEAANIPVDPRERRLWPVERPLMSDAFNPVLLRELRWGTYLSGPYGLGLGGILFAILGVVGLSLNTPSLDAERQSGYPLEVWTIILGIAALAVVPGAAATAVIGEGERETGDSLCMTGLSPREILWGKCSALVVLSARVLALGAVATVFLLDVLVRTSHGVVQVVTGFGSVAVLVCELAAVGIWMSVRARSSAMAALTAYGFSGALLFGPLMIGSALSMVGLETGDGLFSVLSPLVAHYRASRVLYTDGAGTFLVQWAAFSLLHLACAALMFMFATRHYARRWGRHG